MLNYSLLSSLCPVYLWKLEHEVLKKAAHAVFLWKETRWCLWGLQYVCVIGWEYLVPSS